MSSANGENNNCGLKLVLPTNTVESHDSSVTIPCHLSPETSAVNMEIRWFKRTDCVCLYSNSQVTEGRGFEDRVDLFTRELARGNVSLQLKDCRESDAGTFFCQVISGARKAEMTLKLCWDSAGTRGHHWKGFVRQWSLTWTDEEKRQMEKSVQSIVDQTPEVLDETSNSSTNNTSKMEDLMLGGLSEQEPKHRKSIPLFHEVTLWFKASLSDESFTAVHPVFPSPREQGAQGVLVLPSPRLVLLGRSGSGKSAVANAIMGQEERSGTATSSVRQQSESRQGEVAGRHVTVVDTPDWFCPGLSLEELRQDVGHCVRLSAPGPHAFLLVLPVKQSTGEERGMLEKMEEIFGERCWRNTMILFLFTDESEEKHIEDLFFQVGDVQRLANKCENRFHCLILKGDGNTVQVVRLLEKVEEMTGEKKRFYSSKVYLEAEHQARQIENMFVKEIQQTKERREQKAMQKLEKSLQEVSTKLTESEGEFQVLILRHDEQIGLLQQKQAEETNEERKEDIEREIESETQKRREVQSDLEKLEEESVKRRIEIEEAHKEKMEEIAEEFEEDFKVKKGRNFIKVILSEH